jgi:hypothetical protein
MEQAHAELNHHPGYDGNDDDAHDDSHTVCPETGATAYTL